MLNDSDARQVMIVMQNALSHATQISMHNAKDGVVSVEEVVKMAKQIAQEVILIGKKAKES